MEAFATVDDLMLRWPECTVDEETVEARLMDATAYIRSRLSSAGVQVDPDDEVQEYNLKRITCDMVKRSLSASSGQGAFAQAPLKGYMQTAGVFTEQFQFENPTGDLYLLRAEEKALGIGKMRLKIVPVHMEG